MQSFYGDLDSGFFLDFAFGTLGGRFTGVDLQFAADGRAEALVWLFVASKEEDLPVLVAQIAETRQAVGQGVGCVLWGCCVAI